MSEREGCVLAIAKDDGQRYLFLYDDGDESYNLLLRSLGEMAADPTLTFTFYDAAVLTSRARQLREIWEQNNGQTYDFGRNERLGR